MVEVVLAVKEGVGFGVRVFEGVSLGVPVLVKDDVVV